MGFILSLDLGTTSLKLLLLDREGRTAYVHSVAYPTQFPRPNWIEQDPQAWVDALAQGMRALRERFSPNDIEAIGFAGHMSSVVLADAAGIPVYPCITLADGRGVEQAKRLAETLRDPILKATGNLPMNVFALPKILWLQENEPEAFQRAAVWMSAKDYLRLRLTGVMAQDVTDACNSLCVDLAARAWNRPLIEAAGLNESLFPPLLEPYAKAGAVTEDAAALTGLLPGTPVYAGGADMAAGALGLGLGAAGDASVSMGTNAPFMMMIDRVNQEFASALTYHAGAFAGQVYALGSHFNGGLAVNCFSRLFSENGRIDYEMIGRLAAEAEAVPPGCDGVQALPFFAGSGSPWFSPADRAAFIGISAAATRAQLLRATLESVACNMRQSLDMMRTLCPRPDTSVQLYGGGTKIALWPRVIAEVFGLPVSVVQNPDASAVGGALLAGRGAGWFADPLETARANRQEATDIVPDGQTVRTYDRLYRRYLELCGALRPLYHQTKET